MEIQATRNKGRGVFDTRECQSYQRSPLFVCICFVSKPSDAVSNFDVGSSLWHRMGSGVSILGMEMEAT